MPIFPASDYRPIYTGTIRGNYDTFSITVYRRYPGGVGAPLTPAPITLRRNLKIRYAPIAGGAFEDGAMPSSVEVDIVDHDGEVFSTIAAHVAAGATTADYRLRVLETDGRGAMAGSPIDWMGYVSLDNLETRLYPNIEAPSLRVTAFCGLGRFADLVPSDVPKFSVHGTIRNTLAYGCQPRDIVYAHSLTPTRALAPGRHLLSSLEAGRVTASVAELDPNVTEPGDQLHQALELLLLRAHLGLDGQWYVQDAGQIGRPNANAYRWSYVGTPAATEAAEESETAAYAKPAQEYAPSDRETLSTTTLYYVPKFGQITHDKSLAPSRSTFVAADPWPDMLINGRFSRWDNAEKVTAWSTLERPGGSPFIAPLAYYRPNPLSSDIVYLEVYPGYAIRQVTDWYDRRHYVRFFGIIKFVSATLGSGFVPDLVEVVLKWESLWGGAVYLNGAGRWVAPETVLFLDVFRVSVPDRGLDDYETFIRSVEYPPLAGPGRYVLTVRGKGWDVEVTDDIRLSTPYLGLQMVDGSGEPQGISGSVSIRSLMPDGGFTVEQSGAFGASYGSLFGGLAEIQATAYDWLLFDVTGGAESYRRSPVDAWTFPPASYRSLQEALAAFLIVNAGDVRPSYALRVSVLVGPETAILFAGNRCIWLDCVCDLVEGSTSGTARAIHP